MGDTITGSSLLQASKNGGLARDKTLRDEFAGQALALLAHPEENGNPQHTAEQAYRIADAMLKERSK